MKMTDRQLAILGEIDETDHIGGWCPADYAEYRSAEALRRGKMVRRMNKSRNWRLSFYGTSLARRRALEQSQPQEGK